MRRFACVVWLVGCGSSAEPADPPPKPPRVAEAPPPKPLTLRWSNVKTVASCFYFSGPDGRDDKLVGEATVDRRDHDLTLHVGSAEFTGKVNGPDVELKRGSVHEYSGTWRVLETIRGTHQDGVLHALYHYVECGQGDCPGHCTLDAELTIAR